MTCRKFNTVSSNSSRSPFDRFMHAVTFHTVPCRAIPFHSIPFHSIPFHSILFYSMLMPKTNNRIETGNFIIWRTRMQMTWKILYYYTVRWGSRKKLWYRFHSIQFNSIRAESIRIDSFIPLSHHTTSHHITSHRIASHRTDRISPSINYDFFFFSCRWYCHGCTSLLAVVLYCCTEAGTFFVMVCRQADMMWFFVAWFPTFLPNLFHILRK
jgi:hypothetical protein